MTSLEPLQALEKPDFSLPSTEERLIHAALLYLIQTSPTPYVRCHLRLIRRIVNEKAGTGMDIGKAKLAIRKEAPLLGFRREYFDARGAIRWVWSSPSLINNRLRGE